MTQLTPIASTSLIRRARSIFVGPGCFALAIALANGCSASAADQNDDDYGSASDASGYGTTGGDWGTGGPTGTGGANDTEGGEPEPDDEPDETTTTGEEELCDAEMDVVLYLSPDDSNSMSSPVQARAALLDGLGQLYSSPIRVWEFLNYYTFDYPTPAPGELEVSTELLRLVSESDKLGYTLQIGVTSESISNAARAPINVTLVLDESGSMSGNPMEMQIEVCKAIASSLKEGDKVSAVGWDTSNAVKLAGYQVLGPNDPTVLGVCNKLEPGGGTDLNGGLTAGYELAALAYDPARINRVVLISDGGANAGETDADIIGSNSGSNDEDGIYLVGVGVGESNYNDRLMDTVTDLGKGASVFIPDADEAWKIFGDRFVNTMAVAARDVQVELSLPPGFSITKFSGEEFSSDPTEIEPQHLAPNDSMIFHQQIETCAPDLVEDDTEIGVIVRYKDGVTFEERKVEKTLTFADVEGVPSAGLLKGRAVFLYAEALKAIRDNDPESQAAHEEALEAITAAQLETPEDAELVEIRQALEAAL